MKVTFKYGLAGLSGYIEDGVYYYHPQLRRTLMRAYVYPKAVPAAEKMKEIMPNLQKIEPSTGYKTDFYNYLLAYNQLKDYQHKPMLCWNNLYIKMLFALQDADNRVNLLTLSRAQIYDQDLSCKTLKAAVEAGLLPAVKDYHKYDKEI
jgi:hypothetical protein